MKSFYEIAGEIKVPFKVIVECRNQDEAEELADDVTIESLEEMMALKWREANYIIETVDYVNKKVGNLYE